MLVVYHQRCVYTGVEAVLSYPFPVPPSALALLVAPRLPQQAIPLCLVGEGPRQAQKWMRTKNLLQNNLSYTDGGKL